MYYDHGNVNEDDKLCALRQGRLTQIAKRCPSHQGLPKKGFTIRYPSGMTEKFASAIKMIIAFT
jgi:hypothetical protein